MITPPKCRAALPRRLATASLLALALAAGGGCADRPAAKRSGAPNAALTNSAAPENPASPEQAVLSAPTPLFDILPPNAAPGAQPSRLFGSLPYGSSFAGLSAPVMAALRDAQTIVTEAPSGQTGAKGEELEAANLDRLINLQDGETLRKDLDDETGELAERVKAILTQSFETAPLVDAGLVDRMHAFFVLSLLLPAKPKGMTTEGGGARAAAAEAARLGKPVVSLQTKAEAFERKASISPQAAQALLRRLAQDWDSVARNAQKTAEAYESGDFAASRKLSDEMIADLIATAPEAADYLKSQFGRERRRAWADKIEALAQNERILAIVDQSRLTGPDGLVALLLADGWTVRPAGAEAPEGGPGSGRQAGERPAQSEGSSP